MSIRDARYFAELGAWLLSMSVRLPLSQQPKYIADVGCEDGTLLKTLYEEIFASSPRGRRLEEYPLRLIAVGQHQQALAKAAETLAGIPHLTLHKDIDDPEQLAAVLKEQGINTQEDVLYIRSFLEHSPSLILSSQLQQLDDSSDLPDGRNLVGLDGNRAHAPFIEQNLVKLFRRWSEVLSTHGLIILEPHLSASAVVSLPSHESEGLHVDLSPGLLGDQHVAADVFLMAAAQAGLFPKPDCSQKYPKDAPCSHVTLHWFEKRPYTVRHACLADLPVLIRLEAECWVEPLRATAEEIRQRIERFPQGQCVLILDGQVGGVIYSQRIANTEALFSTDFRKVAALHTEQGPIIQLLAANVLPEVQHLGLGDQLLEFMLQYCALKTGIERTVAVTLCKNYANHVPMPMAEYIHKRNEAGMLVDPILRFHEAHGASIAQVVPDYRPPDVANQGKGVLISYDIHNRHRKYSGSGTHVEGKDIGTIIEECILAVLGEERRAAFAPKTSLMDMGLDSLELLELKGRLSQGIGVDLEPTFFFQYGNPEAIVQYLQGKAAEGLLRVDGVDSLPAATPCELEADENATDVLEPVTISADAISEDAIAIIGMACRFPGGVRNPEEYWSLLCNGVDAITEVPKTRWDLDRYYDAERHATGKVFTKYGGFLEDVDQFDAQFFRIAPREAVSIDPQQRILLEETWKALENAGIDPESLRGSQTGTFVGVFTHDYELLQVKHNQATDIDAYFGTGNSVSVVAGRLAYFFGFTGPTMSVDTACSSSLVALHLACQSLRNGECELALAAGVNLLLSPELSIAFSQAGMLAPDGRCKTFDKSANGYVRSEGCGVVVLKPLSRALADNDTILAVVRGTALNQDGASNGLTAPNGRAQEAVIRKALMAAGVSPEAVSYVETHGTGTSLGDPIEVDALKAVYGRGREADNPLIIGSVKTQIGHTEAAAGLAGLIKVVLSMQHKYVPSHLHFSELNPHITLDGMPVVIPARGMEWKQSPSSKPRLAGVSSFGFSGTNAYAILSEAPVCVSPVTKTQRQRHLLTLSAKSERVLQEMAQSYCDMLARRPGQSVADMCFTAHLGRAHFDHRLAVVTASVSELQEQLSVFVAGRAAAGLMSGHMSGKSPQIAFLFTGQGSQYVDMGRRLYETQPTFRRILQHCDEILSPYLGDSLLRVLYPGAGETSPINETCYTQPALFALEYALAALWKSWGIEPQVVLGHSVGEYAAACVAGVFSLEDGLKLIAARGRLMQALPRDGEMLAVLAPEAAVARVIEPYARSVAIAAVNGPENIVISGKAEDVSRVGETLEASGARIVKLTVSHAFHSPLMEPMLEEFGNVTSEVTFRSPRIDLISNVTGKLATGDMATPEYWCRHVRQPVRFAASMATLHQAGYGVFLEIGPKPTLVEMGRRCLQEEIGVWLPSLRPGQEDWQQLLLSLGELYVRGVKVDWSGFEKDYSGHKVMLPTYPFQRQRYWIQARELPSIPSLRFLNPSQAHPLLGQRIPSPLKEMVFESLLSPNSPTFLSDHCVYQRVVMPAAGFLEMALAAGKGAFKSEKLVLQDVVIGQALILPDEEMQKVQVILTQDSTGALFEIHSLDTGKEALENAAWQLHASGRLAVQLPDHQPPQPIDLAQLRLRCAQEHSVPTFYQQLGEHRGVQHGPSFQAIKQLWHGEREALGSIQLPAALASEAERYQFHPVLLDAAFQVLMATFPEAGQSDTLLPVSLERMYVYQRPERNFWSHAQLHPVAGPNQEVVTGDLCMFDDAGNLIAQFEGFSFKRASRESILRSLQSDVGEWLYEISWQSRVREPKKERPLAEKPASWLIFADKHGIGSELAQMLEEQGDRCIQVFPGQAYRSAAGKLYRIDASNPEHFRRVLSEVADLHPPCRGVVHLWGLNETISDEPSATVLRDAQTLGCAAVLHLVQALVQGQWPELPHLWLVTRGAHLVDAPSHALSVLQAPLWGLGRVIAQEHPNLHCVRLDLDPSEHTDEMNALFEALRFPDREDEIAFRQGTHYVARLVRRSYIPHTESLQFDSHSSYLVTGGLGALGLRVAHWMVQQGARHLVLTGRRDPSQQAREVLSQLEQSGARVLVVKSDISKQHDVAQLLERIKTSMPPLRGVIHAAGVMDEGRLVEQNCERFTSVMAPKVDGAWNLHCLTRDLPLNFFVCFSSVASLLGSSGQGNYAAANAFMDALVHYRRALSLPGLSINWGPWAGEGMIARMGSRAQSSMEAIGLGKIAPDLGLKLLGELLGQHDAAQIGVFSVNWDRFIGQFPAGEAPSLFQQFANRVRQHGEAGYSSAPQPKLLRQLDRATEIHHQPQLVTYVQQLVANALGLPPSLIDVQKLLNNMGLDSLMALELRNRLKTDLGVDLPVVKFLAGISVANLAALLHEQLSDISSSMPTPEEEEVKIAEGFMGEQEAHLSQARVHDSDWIEGEI